MRLNALIYKKSRSYWTRVGTRDLQKVKFSTPTRPEKIFNTRNPTLTRKNIFFKPKPDLNLEKYFFFNPKLKKIFKAAYNIRIAIGYKDNFCQVFGINQNFFKSWIKQVSIFFLKKVGF